jgi:hypothetical protein
MKVQDTSLSSRDGRQVTRFRWVDQWVPGGRLLALSVKLLGNFDDYGPDNRMVVNTAAFTPGPTQFNLALSMPWALDRLTNKSPPLVLSAA